MSTQNSSTHDGQGPSSTIRRALVSGATGFIGRYLVERLSADGINVHALSRSAKTLPESPLVQVLNGDVRDPRTADGASVNIDTVFHLAGRAHALAEIEQDFDSYLSVNVGGTRNLIEAAAEAGVRRFVFFSSVKAMGEGSDVRVDESAEPSPTTPYGRTKLMAEEVVFRIGEESGMHVCCLRLPMVIGAGNKGNIFRMIAAIDKKMFPPLPEVHNHRSLVHVQDVVEAAILVATNPLANRKVYIVTDDQVYSTRQLYDSICHRLGKKTPPWSMPLAMLRILARIGDVFGRARGRRFLFDSDAFEKLLGSAWYSSAKITSEMGYHPSTTFETALPGIIRWYRQDQK